MPSQKDPDDKNRPSRPQAQDPFFSGDEWERFSREYDEEWDALSKEEKVAELRHVRRIVDSVIREVTGSVVEQSSENPSLTASNKHSEDPNEPEKRSWAKDTVKKRGEPGGKGNIPRA